MSTIRFFVAVTFATITTGLATVRAGDHCSLCKDTGYCDELVAETITEMKTVTETCYREEKQEKVVRVPKVIQVEKQVPYEYTAWVRVEKEDIQEFEVKTPKFRWVDHKYTIYVPGIDKVTKTRKRVEMVPVTRKVTETVDHGFWETKLVPSEHCAGCLCVEKKVWCSRPAMVEKETVVMEPKTVEEAYECEVPITVPIEKVRKEKEFFTKTETKTVKNPYTTLEPRKRTKTVTAFIPETVYEEKIETCTVKVPYTETKQVPVQVTRMVPGKKICACQSH